MLQYSCITIARVYHGTEMGVEVYYDPSSVKYTLCMFTIAGGLISCRQKKEENTIPACYRPDSIG